MADDKTPAGSEPIAPLQLDNQEPAQTLPAESAPAPKEDKQEAKSDDHIARFEKMLSASQSMIGKQSNEIGALRAKLEEMSQPKEQGPSEDQQLAELYQRMDSGEIGIAEGMRAALDLNTNLTAKKVMAQFQQQQQQGKIAEVQNKFLKDNPDYQEVLQSGALSQYMEADPLADEYTAYHKFKADEKLAGVQKEYEGKISAAKEEGAKLAKGAEAAGKVLGKQGGSAMAPQVQRPFANRQEAVDAMKARLDQMRSASAQ